jgi:hypothetical protein
VVRSCGGGYRGIFKPRAINGEVNVRLGVGVTGSVGAWGRRD